MAAESGAHFICINGPDVLSRSVLFEERSYSFLTGLLIISVNNTSHLNLLALPCIAPGRLAIAVKKVTNLIYFVDIG